MTTHYMDEAERCGRVGYIYLSRLIANGTPDELKCLSEVSPPGTSRLEIETTSTAQALGLIKRQPYTHAATIFGQSIHLLMETSAGQARVEADLRAGGFAAARVRPIHPTLEDVFVTLTEARKKEIDEE